MAVGARRPNMLRALWAEFCMCLLLQGKQGGALCPWGERGWEGGTQRFEVRNHWPVTTQAGLGMSTARPGPRPPAASRHSPQPGLPARLASGPMWGSACGPGPGP